MKMPLYSSSHIAQIPQLYPLGKLPFAYYFQPWSQEEYSKIKKSENTPLPQTLPPLSGFAQKLLSFYEGENLHGNVLSLGAGISTIEIQCVIGFRNINSMTCVDLEPFMENLPNLTPPEIRSKFQFHNESFMNHAALMGRFGANKFDAIMINQVIYALSDAELGQLLQFCEQLLNPKGKIYILCSSLLNGRSGLNSLRISFKILLGNKGFKPIGVLRTPFHLLRIVKKHTQLVEIPLTSDIPISFKLERKG